MLFAVKAIDTRQYDIAALLLHEEMQLATLFFSVQYVCRFTRRTDRNQLLPDCRLSFYGRFPVECFTVGGCVLTARTLGLGDNLVERRNDSLVT